MRKEIVFTFFLLFTFSLKLYTQKIETLTIPPDGSIIKSQITDTNATYTITIEGTYSMWPQFTDCHGVDAAYVYDVPQEEIDNFRWPPQKITVGNLVIPFVELPHWVGDDKVWRFPPAQIGMPIFELSFRKYTGFRIDGEPLPNTGFQPLTHRYQIEKRGTGKPFEFQILDSNYNILKETVIPRYEDNCGSLKVTIEKIEEEGLKICDIKPICKDEQIIGLKVLASIFLQDTASLSGKLNILQFINPKQIGVVENGIFRCDIDSIKCDISVGSIAIGLLVDRSGSMSLPISENDQTIRMDALKKSISDFIDNLRDIDSVFVMSFSETIILEQDWTNDKNALKSAINKLQPDKFTAFFGGLLQALNKLSISPNPYKYLIVLSDGANTYPPEWSDDILSAVQKANIPIFIIAFGLSTQPEDVEGRRIFGIIAQASRGKVFDVYNSNQLDSVYQQLSRDIYDPECCAIYFKIDTCKPGEERFVRLIYAPRDTTIFTKVIKFTCDSCEKIYSTVIPDNNFNLQSYELNITPNPAANQFRISFSLSKQSKVNYKIVDLMGNIVSDGSLGEINEGLHYFDFSDIKINQGIYIVSIITNDDVITRKLIIIK